ncbi:MULTISPECIES: hypothetical protein [Janthinobacterium]|uniref:hypothetical protein n=1 Tax=Janthinobacterium TaxID=29580 RepID=UPI000874C38E|nr:MULTISPECIES: hypothetical protein [Janthinobacterium]MCC7698738.1 hypothetical protein [Janthinobacterium sp. EB271-G4-7A]MCC7714485.1 hypothetical protein [Janthinobacterium lividum]PHV20478.1 hypothetical protein CSQ92_20270 [Janthinobacterium sp. BJB446]WQE30313.1 hypothetical protein U0004_07795 [Janthinobacterium lividum]
MATVHEQRQRRIEHALLRDPGAVVDVSIRLWEQLATELNQIIGERGVESMYARSLHQSQKQFNWLTPHPPQALEAAMRALRASLQGQAETAACAASTAMMMHFINTLILLIGELLTNSILLKAWGDDVVNNAGTEPNE